MQTAEEKKVPAKKKKRKRKNDLMNYFILFIIVFVITLGGLSYLVKSFTPKVEIEIGENNAVPLSESDMNVEVKSVDERLKWIQMEDEMPSVAIREAKESTEKEILDKQIEKEILNEKTSEVVPKPEKSLSEQEPIFKKQEVAPKPSISDIVNLPVSHPNDFRMASSAPIIPAPKPPSSLPVTPSPVQGLMKVYLGSYSSVDDAMNIQQKVSSDIPEAMPFIKSQNGAYIVQLGSFSNRDVANKFILKLKEKGYSPKIIE